MRNRNKLIEILNRQLEALREIQNKSGYIDYHPFSNNQGLHQETQKLNRWEIRTSQVIKKYINAEEKNRFESCANNMDLGIQIQQYDSYLQELINDIKNNSEFFDESQSDDLIIDVLNNMHEEVVKISKDKIQYGDYKNIILDTCISLENHIKKKINNPNLDISGAKLMEHIFSKDKFIIELSDKKEERKGFMFLFSGVIKAIRNQFSHKLYSINLQEAVEILGFLSFLFRTVDKGKVKK